MRTRKKTKTERSGSDTLSLTTTRKASRRKRGGLQNLPDMPLDILLEIFQYLGLRDLLYLAKTSKNLRRFLLNRQSCGRLWKTIMEDQGYFPERLPFLSEMAWINLLFSPYCHGCSRDNVEAIFWEFGVRYCRTCKRKLMQTFTWISNEHKVPEELDTKNISPEWLSNCDGYIHVPELTEFVALWRSTPENEREQLVQERIAMVKETRERANWCREWMDNKAQEHVEERENIKRQRGKDILSLLEEMGWREEFDMMSYDDFTAFKRRPEFRQAKPLTAHAWQGMRDKLVAWLEEKKTERIENERTLILVHRIKQLSWCIDDSSNALSSVIRRKVDGPIIADIAMFPEVRDIVELPNEEVVTETVFQPVVDVLPGLIARWHEEITAQLGQELRKSYEEVLKNGPKTSDGTEIVMDLQGITNADLVNLATSIFFCTRCERELGDHSVAAHSCGRRDSPLRKCVPSTYSDLYLRAVVTVGDCEPWSRECIASYTNAQRIARVRMIADLCGLDWKAVTWKEIDTREERFICTCQLCVRSRSIVVMHGCYVRTFDSSTKHNPLALKIANPTLTAIAKRQEKKNEYIIYHGSETDSLCCARCIPMHAYRQFGNYVGLKRHLVIGHGLKLDEIQEEDMLTLPRFPLHPIEVTEWELNAYMREHS